MAEEVTGPPPRLGPWATALHPPAVLALADDWPVLPKLAQRPQVTRDTHRPVYPEMFTIQLESWDIYEDWERATEIPMYPGGPCFQELRSPVISYDSNMRRAERANPEGFAVEHRAHWAAAQDAYLDPVKVSEMFQPWNGRDLIESDSGLLSVRYVAHADPSQSNANFGLAIAHVEGPDEDGLMHVVYD